MQIKKILPQLTIHETPLPQITISDKHSEIIIEFDDKNEKRIKIIFSPYQAIKITTLDCFDMSEIMNNEVLERSLLLVESSKWIKELKGNLKTTNKEANFMDKANHYILPFTDSNIVEIVASGYQIT